MVATCVVIGCTNRATKGAIIKRTYHKVPKVNTSHGEQTETVTRKRREAWIAAVGRPGWEPTPFSKVCSDHFVSGKYM